MRAQRCAVENCDRPRWAREWCQRHYGRWYRHGDPCAGRVAKGTDVFVRFFDKVLIGDGCWEWAGARNADDYGNFKSKGEQRAHRIAWRLWYGPIPDGMWVLHRCDNPPCVRPDHLFLGTPLENTRDMNRKGRNGHSAKTHCPAGHLYSEANTRVGPSGKRNCRACGREAVRRSWRKKKQVLVGEEE